MNVKSLFPEAMGLVITSCEKWVTFYSTFTNVFFKSLLSDYYRHHLP